MLGRCTGWHNLLLWRFAYDGIWPLYSTIRELPRCQVIRPFTCQKRLLNGGADADVYWDIRLQALRADASRHWRSVGEPSHDSQLIIYLQTLSVMCTWVIEDYGVKKEHLPLFIKCFLRNCFSFLRVEMTSWFFTEF